MKREPERKVPVVRMTELAEIGWLSFAEKMQSYKLKFVHFSVTEVHFTDTFLRN